MTRWIKQLLVLYFLGGGFLVCMGDYLMRKGNASGLGLFSNSGLIFMLIGVVALAADSRISPHTALRPIVCAIVVTGICLRAILFFVHVAAIEDPGQLVLVIVGGVIALAMSIFPAYARGIANPW